MFRTPQQNEPAPNETLYLSTKWLPKGMYDCRVIVGATKDNADGEYATVSLCIASFSDKGNSEFGHAWLTFDEVDILIKALGEAKERLVEYRHAAEVVK
uniref:Uncharacterized protein n=1 Tax=viral metagenome TaxID=1070528 RepID=A0A6M3IMU5_9ZZZZ